MSDTMTVRVAISGIVQGVGYRGWVIRQARHCCLSGFVRNRFDGTVEAVFSGSSAHVVEMVNACREGPSYARVGHVACSSADPPPAGFRCLPTV